MNPREQTGHLAQIISVVAFSIGVMVQKGLVDRYPPADVVALQFAIAMVAMWIVCARLGYLPKRLSDAIPGIMWGCVTPGLVFLFTSAGSSRTDAVSVALIWGLIPLVGPILGRIVLGERFHWSLPFGASLAFAGLLFLTLDRQAIGAGELAGNLLVVAGAASALAGQLAGRRLNTRGAPWFRIATLQLTGATLISSVVAFSDLRFVLPAATDTDALAGLVYLVLGMTMVNFIGYNLALSRIPVAWIALYSSLSPAIGTLTAAILLDALVRPLDAAGIAVIIAGVALPHILRIAQAKRQVRPT